MPKPTLIYFAARGRAELIRLLLAEAAVDYHEHVVGRGTPPSDGRPTDLAALKATGALPFDAVPVWEEPGGLRLAQSGAIANHIARTHGMRGRDALEEAQCDQLLGAVDDVRLELRKLGTVAADQRPAQRTELASTTLPRWLGHLDRLLQLNGGGAGFVVGASITVADVALWYLLELLRGNGFGSCLERYPALVAFADRIGSRPRLAAYAKSARRPPFVPLPA
jgi:glutathione S-transferase